MVRPLVHCWTDPLIPQRAQHGAISLNPSPPIHQSVQTASSSPGLLRSLNHEPQVQKSKSDTTRPLDKPWPKSTLQCFWRVFVPLRHREEPTWSVAFFRRSDTTSGRRYAYRFITQQLQQALSSCLKYCDTSFRLTPSHGFLEEQKRDFLLDWYMAWLEWNSESYNGR